MEYESMGKLIQTLRKEKGLTQKQLADMLNITDKAISKWERDVACPDTATIPKLAEILDISVEDLLNAKASSAMDADKSLVEEETDTPFDTDAYNEDQEHRQYYFNELKKTLIFAAISFVIFTTIFANIMAGAEVSIIPAIIAGLFYAGIPSGWSITGKVFSGWIITNTAGILVLIIRAILSVVIGIFALPIKVISYISKCCATPSETNIVQHDTTPMSRKVIIALIIYVAIIVLTCVGLFFGLRTNSKDSNSNTETAPQNSVSASSFSETNYDLDNLCQKALSATQSQENENTESGWSVTNPSQIHGVYYLKASNLNDPYRNALKKLDVVNAVVVVTGYFVEKAGPSDINEWEMVVTVYPNFIFDENDSLTYDNDSVYSHSLRSDDIEDLMEWLSSEYADMNITEIAHS